MGWNLGSLPQFFLALFLRFSEIGPGPRSGISSSCSSEVKSVKTIPRGIKAALDSVHARAGASCRPVRYRFVINQELQEENQRLAPRSHARSETVVLDAAPGRVDQDANGAHAGSSGRLGPRGLYHYMLSDGFGWKRSGRGHRRGSFVSKPEFHAASISKSISRTDTPNPRTLPELSRCHCAKLRLP